MARLVHYDAVVCIGDPTIAVQFDVMGMVSDSHWLSTLRAFSLLPYPGRDSFSRVESTARVAKN
jgi:hypothetical protein